MGLGPQSVPDLVDLWLVCHLCLWTYNNSTPPCKFSYTDRLCERIDCVKSIFNPVPKTEFPFHVFLVFFFLKSVNERNGTR